MILGESPLTNQSMHYEQGPEASGELLRMIVPTLTRLGIPLSPVNYALWYEYYLGRNDALNRALEAIANGEVAYDPMQAERLFKEHLLDAQAVTVGRVGDEVRLLVEKLMEAVGHSGKDVGAYEKSLHGYSRDLHGLKSTETLRDLIASAIDETKHMLVSHQAFQSQLSDTSEDIAALRQELAEIRQHVSQDPLTGVANRRAFDEALYKASEEALDQDKSVCVMMVDIDHFKRINDEHGHLIGDKVIKFVASTLKKLVRGADFVARFGGEEFGVILDDTPEQGALIVAENVRRSIEESRLKRTDTGDPIGTVTVSVGVSRYGRGDSAQSLLDRADKALYSSKKAGRNRVSFHGR